MSPWLALLVGALIPVVWVPFVAWLEDIDLWD